MSSAPRSILKGSVQNAIMAPEPDLFLYQIDVRVFQSSVRFLRGAKVAEVNYFEEDPLPALPSTPLAPKSILKARATIPATNVPTDRASGDNIPPCDGAVVSAKSPITKVRFSKTCDVGWTWSPTPGYRGNFPRKEQELCLQEKEIDILLEIEQTGGEIEISMEDFRLERNTRENAGWTPREAHYTPQLPRDYPHAPITGLKDIAECGPDGEEDVPVVGRVSPPAPCGIRIRQIDGPYRWRSTLTYIPA